jgi:pyruvoyl-dependent arginine decarboxylase (PvlArgDC)
MMVTSRMTKQDKMWRAQSDAGILAEAEVIKNDRTRLKMAASEAKRMADEAVEKAKSMTKIAKTKVSRKGKK